MMSCKNDELCTGIYITCMYTYMYVYNVYSSFCVMHFVYELGNFMRVRGWIGYNRVEERPNSLAGLLYSNEITYVYMRLL